MRFRGEATGSPTDVISCHQLDLRVRRSRQLIRRQDLTRILLSCSTRLKVAC